MYLQLSLKSNFYIAAWTNSSSEIGNSYQKLYHVHNIKMKTSFSIAFMRKLQSIMEA